MYLIIVIIVYLLCGYCSIVGHDSISTLEVLDGQCRQLDDQATSLENDIRMLEASMENDKLCRGGKAGLDRAM